MKLFLPFLLALALPIQNPNPNPSQDPAPKPKAEKKASAPVYDEKAVGKDQIAAALVRAKRENRRVLVQWGGNWCPFCVALADLEKTDAGVSKELLYEYDVVKIDIGTWQNTKHGDLITKYGADIKKHGIPYLTVLDADGKVLANQGTAVLEDGNKEKAGHDPKKVLDFLKGLEAPHVQAQAVYDAALADAKKDGKRVFLHFGAPTCVWCHRLEDWMEKPQMAALLGKEFVDCKIDIDRATGGKEMLARLTEGQAVGIPWFVFLDADGKTIVHSGLGNDNVGFPAKPEEIARFRTLLEKACVKLTKDEIGMLVDSLVPPKKPDDAKPAGDKPTDGKPAGTGGSTQ
jgi:thioredoxin-related protein